MSFVSYDPAKRKLDELMKMKHLLPKEAADMLDTVSSLVDKRESYCERMTTKESPALAKIRKAAGTSTMTTDHLEGQFLKTLVSMTRAKKILEIGLFFGHGARAMAEAIPADGTVVSCEIEAEQVEKTQKLLDQSPHGKKIQIKQDKSYSLVMVLTRPAKDTLLKLAEEGDTFDFIFMDADKQSQKEYYKTIFGKQLLAPRGTLVVDNAFYFGESYDTDGTYEAHPVRKFNEFVVKDETVHRVSITKFVIPSFS
ncbi:hypothetical protein ScPMuIL_010789 [Solemya velum]